MNVIVRFYELNLQIDRDESQDDCDTEVNHCSKIRATFALIKDNESHCLSCVHCQTTEGSACPEDTLFLLV